MGPVQVVDSLRGSAPAPIGWARRPPGGPHEGACVDRTTDPTPRTGRLPPDRPEPPDPPGSDPPEDAGSSDGESSGPPPARPAEPAVAGPERPAPEAPTAPPVRERQRRARPGAGDWSAVLRTGGRGMPRARDPRTTWGRRLRDRPARRRRPRQVRVGRPTRIRRPRPPPDLRAKRQRTSRRAAQALTARLDRWLRSRVGRARGTGRRRLRGSRRPRVDPAQTQVVGWIRRRAGRRARRPAPIRVGPSLTLKPWLRVARDTLRPLRWTGRRTPSLRRYRGSFVGRRRGQSPTRRPTAVPQATVGRRRSSNQVRLGRRRTLKRQRRRRRRRSLTSGGSFAIKGLGRTRTGRRMAVP